MTAAHITSVTVILILAAVLLGPRIRRAFTRARDVVDGAYESIPRDVTWDKPPAPGARLNPPEPHPAPGHHRGNHMVIDVWRCGCIYTWTRASGWVHDFDCLDEELRDLLERH